MSLIQEIKEQVLQGNQIAKAEALQLYGEPLEELCLAADEIRYQFCGNRFDLCTIINGKSGRCSENCKYCAQSLKNIRCLQWRRSKSRRNTMKKEESCVIRS